MRLHENKELFLDSILATSQLLNLPEIYIEKDYWVTVALYEIFHSNMADQTVFKGGTALSKCSKLINRFSEDIDVVVIRNKGETDNQLKRKIRDLTKIVEAIMPEIEIEGLTNKKGNFRKTAHRYNKLHEGEFGQIREHIILDATWLGNFEPYTNEKVGSYIVQMMENKGLIDFIKKYSMHPFPVKVLSKERTLCEKIMSLVRFSRQSNPYSYLANKIRHIYDIHMMLKNGEIITFFESNALDKMLVRVGRDDVISYKNDNKWLLEHPANALIFDMPKKTWDMIKTPYRTTFKGLVIGELPLEKDLINTLKCIAERLKLIEWKISI
ncbi:MAG: nucleotidyl transferase AbiEii/AbiGii toxin family protein [Candidatus Cloacimonetes bacterium]|nr:nucleotidyl transferase AbiEii/AbiGii toxin family protein [Candidatus Cloacimonadota bacterium]